MIKSPHHFPILSVSPSNSIQFYSDSIGREIQIDMTRLVFGLMSFILLVLSVLPSGQSQSMAPAPAPTSDGTSIDQGIACLLMVVALVLTYLIHPLDASPCNFFATC